MNKILKSTGSKKDIAQVSDSVTVAAATRTAPVSLTQRLIARIHPLAARFKSHLKDTLSNRHTLGSFFLLLSIISFSALGGFVIGQGESVNRQDLVIIPASFSNTGVPSVSSTGRVEVVRIADAQALSVQNEVTHQLGQLRAELLRLHSVFVHMAKMAELDDGEFDLQSPKMDWQEQSSVKQLGLLNRRIAHMSANSDAVKNIFDIRRMAYDQKISGWPIAEGHKSSGFGYRTDPMTGERSKHRGLDFSGSIGEPILAMADGIVTFSGENFGYGNLVELEHVGGLRTRYAHNHANIVARGARVKKGEVIAMLGSTGRSTGPHVHIEVRLDGSPIDPGIFVR